MECNVFEIAVSESADLSQLRPELLQHAQQCFRCSGLLEDFQTIARKARKLASVEPARDLWGDIRAQLEREGLIQTELRPAAQAARGVRDRSADAVPAPRLVHSAPRSR